MDQVEKIFPIIVYGPYDLGLILKRSSSYIYNMVSILKADTVMDGFD